MKYSLALLAASALLFSYRVALMAQTSPEGGAMGSAAAALTGEQQSAAKSALCSALASHFSNPAAAGPSALSSPAVLSSAAPMFAAKTKMPVSGATDMLKSYVAEHAADIFASCAVSNVPEGMPSGIPGGMPSIPKMP